MKISEQLMLTHADAVRMAQHVDRKDENLKGDFVRLFRLLKTSVTLALTIEKESNIEPDPRPAPVGPEHFKLGI